jgi:peroxin-19
MDQNCKPPADDLSDLLDNALQDFGKKKNTDDDLDEFMAGIDREAAQQAAKNFQVMLENMVTTIEKDHQKEEETNATSAEEGKFLDGIKDFMQRSSVLANAPDEQSYMEALNNLQEPNAVVDDLMGMIAQTVLSRDIMHPAIKDVCDKYGPYLEENRDKLDKDTLERYTAQHQVFIALCQEYEKSDSAETEDSEQRLNVIGKLWMELQKFGMPPAEVAGALPSGWDTDPDTGLPKNNPDEASAEACAIM